MKQHRIFLLGVAVVLILGSTMMVPGFLAAASPADSQPALSTPKIELPMNRRCVVSLDPRDSSKPVVAGTANIVTGFDAPNTVEGVLVMLNAEWLVLRVNKSENWIPKDKIIMIHVPE